MMKKIKCILLVDDNPADNHFHRLIIQRWGKASEVAVVESAEEALDYLTNSGDYTGNGTTYPQPELIFLDINMPRMNGWEFLEAYQKLPIHQKGKIVITMLTTSLNEDDKARAKLYEDINSFKNKPLTKEILEELYHQHFAES